MKKIKAGLLPLYIELYDTSSPNMRPVVTKFLNSAASELRRQGIDIIVSDICCVKQQFADAVAMFEQQNIDAIITLHLAYSPSLESSDVLANTKLPIVVMDTTPDYAFDCTVSAEAILYNHGIHGVQDMCNLLKRNCKDFEIFAGHYTESDICKRVADCVRAISAANKLKSMRVGIIGKMFEGMGDFLVSDAVLKNLGIEKVVCREAELKKHYDKVTKQQIKEEFILDQKRYNLEGITFDKYAATEKVALAVREWVLSNNLDAFTINFQSAGSFLGLETMPFSESGKQMLKGIGYAGEGDVLTAAFVGSLLSGFMETSFAEMFCPDWKGGSVFLSHMGEGNHAVMESLKMIIKDFPYADAFNPTCIVGNFKGGSACLVNIAPNIDGHFDMIIAPGEMLSVTGKTGEFSDAMSGWFKPATDLEEFLENYSKAGGTHHCAIVYNTDVKALKAYAKTLNLNAITV